MSLAQLLEAFTSDTYLSIPGGPNLYWYDILIPLAVAKNFISVVAVSIS